MRETINHQHARRSYRSTQSLARLQKILANAGLPDIRFHDLRHTAASLMLNSNVPLILVSKRLDHARSSITLDIYGHLIPSMQADMARMIEELVTPVDITASIYPNV